MDNLSDLVDKHVLIFLKNGFRYKGRINRIREFGNTLFVEIEDQKNSFRLIAVDQFQNLEVLGGKNE